MQTRGDIESEVTARLMLATNAEVFSPTRVTSVVQDSHSWAGSRHFWPSTMRARLFTVTAPNTQGLNYDYYDYPVDFVSNSASRLYIDGIKYEKKAFMDFLDYVDNTQQASVPPDPTKHYFAEYGRQFFTYPTYSGAGTAKNGIIWGNIQVPLLSSANTYTIFSLWDDSLNEAIVQKAISVLVQRLDANMAVQNLQQAQALLDTQWSKIALGLQRAQRLNHPFFVVPDLFNANAGQSTIGNFAIAQGGY